MNIRKFILPISIFFISSCSSFENPLEDLSKNTNTLTTDMAYSNYITPSEADSIAISALTNIYANNKSRFIRAITPKQTYIYGFPKSRSITNDTTFYVVNFAPEGFALVAADRRIKNPIYAFSDKGSFDNPSENPGQNFYMKVMKADIDAECANTTSLPDLPVDPDTPPHPGGFQPSDPSEGAIIDFGGTKCYVKNHYDYDEVEPMVYTQWHQGMPYNTYCVDRNGKAGDTGCTAIAIAQILSYHKSQVPNGSREYNWDAMLASPTSHGLSPEAIDDIAHLTYTVGTLANIDYKSGSSATSYNNAFKAIKDLGFTAQQIRNWDSSILTSLKEDGPIFMCGKESKNSGHSWVVDGYKLLRTTTDYYRFEDDMKFYTTTDDTIYLRINWGSQTVNPTYYRQASSYEVNGHNYTFDIAYIIKIKK